MTGEGMKLVSEADVQHQTEKIRQSVIEETKRKKDEMERRRFMFDELKEGGYNCIKVGCDGYDGFGHVRWMAFYRGDVEVRPELVPEKDRIVVALYLTTALPGGWENDAGSYGAARICPACEFITFTHAERSEEWMEISYGEPDPNVSDQDRWLNP